MSDSSTSFTELLIEALATGFEGADGVSEIEPRSLFRTDTDGSLGICLDRWVAVDWEMRGCDFPGLEPSVCNYEISLQHMVKDSNRTRGEAAHRKVATGLRQMLYRHQPMMLGLRSLSYVDDSVTPIVRERILNWSVIEQLFSATEMDSQFVFFSNTSIRFVTESV